METDKLSIGDTVSSKAHPEIKSKIKEIKRSRFTDEMMYFCSNGCIYTRDEIKKSEIMKTKEQILFDLVQSIGEYQNNGIHIIDNSSYPVFEEDKKYRIYHSYGYCFDIECFRNYELGKGESHNDYDEEEFEYVFYNGWEGFKYIDIDQAIEIIKKITE